MPSEWPHTHIYMGITNWTHRVINKKVKKKRGHEARRKVK